MTLSIRPFTEDDYPAFIAVWNAVSVDETHPTLGFVRQPAWITFEKLLDAEGGTR